MKKQFLSIILAFCLVLSLSAFVSAADVASGTYGDNLTWTLDDAGTLTISGTGEMKSSTTISELLWYDYRSDIKSVIIENGVTSIGSWAFHTCTNLTSITIPDSVTSIESSAFFGCTSLTSINVDKNNSTYCSDNDVLFNKDKTTLIQYPACKNEVVYTIPDSVASIGQQAFYSCENLTSITIPDSVTSIGFRAFSLCTNLTSITIPDSVTSIGSSAFFGCTSLTSINVDENNSRYCSDNGVLFNKRKTSLVCYPAGKNEAVYTIPDGVIFISTAFEDCTSLTNIIIPDSVTSIGNAFGGCISLTSINVDENNSTYCSDNGVLFNKDKTSLVCYPAGKNEVAYTIPDSVTSIGDDAFCCCENLTNITIPDSVTSIGGNAFLHCGSLTSITIPDSVTSIGMQAFCYCENLTSITIPDSVTSIGRAAFLLCKNLTSITIPDSVTSIGMQAFYSCENLTSITIPDSVTSIDDDAFYVCPSLTDVYYIGSEEQRDAVTIGLGNEALEEATIHYLFYEDNLVLTDMSTAEVAGQTIHRVGLFAGIDSLEYSSVGFEITCTDNGASKEVTSEDVYNTVSYSTADGRVTKTPANFGASSKYIFGFIQGFTQAYKDSYFKVRPFAVNLLGHKIHGNWTENVKIYTR